MLIQQEEKEFFAKITEDIKQVEKNDRIILTKFLTLREQEITNELLRNANISCEFNGGYDNAERKRCLLYPKTLNFDNKFNITCYRIDYNKRYLTLTHQNVLGTLMSLKLDRALFGDIIFSSDECYFYTSSEIEPLLLMELTTINRVPITVEKYEGILDIEEKYTIKEVIISSMRIDNLISHVYNLSREQAGELVLGNLVYKNFQVITSKSAKCDINDVISVRKYGRFIVSNILRSTRSNKLVLEIKIPTT